MSQSVTIFLSWSVIDRVKRLNAVNVPWCLCVVRAEASRVDQFGLFTKLRAPPAPSKKKKEIVQILVPSWKHIRFMQLNMIELLPRNARQWDPYYSNKLYKKNWGEEGWLKRSSSQAHKLSNTNKAGVSLTQFWAFKRFLRLSLGVTPWLRKLLSPEL